MKGRWWIKIKQTIKFEDISGGLHKGNSSKNSCFTAGPFSNHGTTVIAGVQWQRASQSDLKYL